MQFIHFVQAINNTGNNDNERAQKLGIPLRTLTRYKAGRLPRSLLLWVHNPKVLEALLQDAKSLEGVTE